MLSGITYTRLRETDFYSFFNLREIKREYHENEIISIFLKPGGFQEFIDIFVQIRRDVIIKAILELDRKWIGDITRLNTFAQDITKSFIGALISDEVGDFKLLLVQGIWNLKGTQDRIICLDEVVRNWESVNPQIKKILDVYRGIKLSYEISFEKVILSIFNELDKVGNRNKLLLRIEIPI